MELIKTCGLTKQFSHVKALNDVSISIESGKIYGLLGPNGSGKSTCMKLIAGLCYRTKGEIYAMNSPLSIDSKNYIAYMPTESFFYDYMTIRHAKEYFQDFYTDFNTEKFKSLLDFMNLTENLQINKLSSGMNAKLWIALTMSRDAKVFLLDEPLNGIDLVARDSILKTIIEGTTDDNAIVISSHLIDTIESILDEVILIKEGSVAIAGSAEQVREKNNKSIVDLYKEVFAC